MTDDLKWKKDIVDRAELITRLLAAMNFPIDFTTTGALRLVAFQLDAGREAILTGPDIGDLTLNQINDKINKVATEIKDKSLQELDFILADQRK